MEVIALIIAIGMFFLYEDKYAGTAAQRMTKSYKTESLKDNIAQRKRDLNEKIERQDRELIILELEELAQDV